MGPTPKDLTGLVVNGIEFLSFSHRGDGSHGKRFWKLRCHCGNDFIAAAISVKSEHTKSCGCLLKKFLSTGNARRTHGYAGQGRKRSGEYNIWSKMIQRCTNPNDPKHPDYGGRGIIVCERWRNSFADFLADMGPRPEATYSIHRINNDGHYEPGNCCWATKKTQARVRRSSRLLEINGRQATLAEIAETHGLTIRQLWSRLRLGWTLEQALSKPLRDWGPNKPKPKT